MMMMMTAFINEPNLVSCQHLSPILVPYVDETRWLDPRLTIHLNWNSFIPDDCDFHSSTLKTKILPVKTSSEQLLINQLKSIKLFIKTQHDKVLTYVHNKI